MVKLHRAAGQEELAMSDYGILEGCNTSTAGLLVWLMESANHSALYEGAKAETDPAGEEAVEDYDYKRLCAMFNGLRDAVSDDGEVVARGLAAFVGPLWLERVLRTTESADKAVKSRARIDWDKVAAVARQCWADYDEPAEFDEEPAEFDDTAALDGLT